MAQQNDPAFKPIEEESSVVDSAFKPIVDVRGPSREATEIFAEENPIIGKPVNVGLDIISQLTSPVDLGLTLGTLGANLPATAARVSVPRALGWLRKGTGGALASRGAYNVGTAESPGEAIAGGMEVLGGLAGARLPGKTSIPRPTRNVIDLVDNAVDDSYILYPDFFGGGQGKILKFASLDTPRPQWFRGGDSGWIKAIESHNDEVEKFVSKNARKFDPDSLAMELWNLPRGITASLDLPPFRQGLPLIATGAWWKSWNSMIRSYGSEKVYNIRMSKIKANPRYKEALEDGVKFTDLTKLSTREESIMSTLAEKIPVMGRFIRGSNRGHTIFLNEIRMRHYQTMIDDIERSLPVEEGITPYNKKAVADFINNATGRGNLGGLESSANVLNKTIFSPRLTASRAHMFNEWFNPVKYIRADPVIRQQRLKSLLATTSAWGTMAGLAQLGGADVTFDSRNSDFMKVRIGNTRLDPGGGFLQWLVLASRIQSLEKVNSVTGDVQGIGDYGIGDPIMQFINNKAHPMVNYIIDMYRGRKSESEYSRFRPVDRTLELFVPMMIADILEIARENPEALPMMIPGSFGMSVQTYTGDPGQHTFVDF